MGERLVIVDDEAGAAVDTPNDASSADADADGDEGEAAEEVI